MKSSVKVSNMHDLAEYQRFLWKHPRLQFLFFELTDQCNLCCKHCGSSCTNKNNSFLPYAVIENTMREVAQAYNPQEIMICLTGGEPLLHPKLYRVIYMARLLGFSVGMTSNGTLIDDDCAEKLAAAGLNSIAISIDGLEKEHDAFRRATGSFRKAMNGVHSLRKAGIEAQAISVIHKENLHLLNEMYEFFRNDGFYSWRIVSIDPIGRAKDNSGLLLDADELKQLLEFIRTCRFDPNNTMDVTYGCSHFLTFEYENEVRDYYFQCGAGTKVGSIMANGDIGACLDIERRPELIQGNIYRDSFLEVWNKKYQLFREDRTEKSEVCSECENRSFCLGDSAHTWDWNQNRPMYCVNCLCEGWDKGK